MGKNFSIVLTPFRAYVDHQIKNAKAEHTEVIQVSGAVVLDFCLPWKNFEIVEAASIKEGILYQEESTP